MAIQTLQNIRQRWQQLKNETVKGANTAQRVGSVGEDTFDTVNDSATNAQTSANNAQQMANNAQQIANSALQKVNTVKDDIDNLKNNVLTLENDISDILNSVVLGDENSGEAYNFIALNEHLNISNIFSIADYRRKETMIKGFFETDTQIEGNFLLFFMDKVDFMLNRVVGKVYNTNDFNYQGVLYNYFDKLLGKKGFATSIKIEVGYRYFFELTYKI